MSNTNEADFDGHTPANGHSKTRADVAAQVVGAEAQNYDHAVERSVTEVVAQRVEFLGPRPERPADEQSDEPEAITDEASEALADEQPADATPAAPVLRRRRAS